MNTILKPIALNEQSYNVSLLHKALAALGSPVAKGEVDQGKAGSDTLKKVRALQEQCNMAVDESVLLDEATALAITKALDERGLLATSRSFTVTGTVRFGNGPVKKRQKPLAFDLDLSGVSVYRRVKTLAKIKKSGGFEYLGEAVSDNQGNYRITFSTGSLARPNAKRPMWLSMPSKENKSSVLRAWSIRRIIPTKAWCGTWT